MSVSTDAEVISIGTNCKTAYFLKKMGLRTCSYPWDWLFSDLWVVQDCLENDFRTFMDPLRYVPNTLSPHSDEMCGHTTYGLHMFNHKNPRRPEDYEYYRRCVARFRELMSTDKPKIFLHVRINQERALVYNELKQLVDLKHAIDARTTNARLVVIHCYTAGMIEPQIYGLPFDMTLCYIPTEHSDGLNFKSMDSWKIFYKCAKQAIEETSEP